MIAEIKAEWIRRLRSGEYKQGFAFMCQRFVSNVNELLWDAFGILMQMAEEAGAIKQSFWKPDIDGKEYKAWPTDVGWTEDTLTKDCRAWAGLTGTPLVWMEIGEFPSDCTGGLMPLELYSLAVIHDTRQFTFAKQADMIARQSYL